MDTPDANNPTPPASEIDLTQLGETFQLLAADASREELDTLKRTLESLGASQEQEPGLDRDEAALMQRLAQHFSDAFPTSSLSADGHAAPQKVGRYTIIRELGSGGFGVVYLGRDETLGRNVAIKLPRRDTVRDEFRRQQILNEAHTAGSLEHPGIIPIYDTGSDAETVYIVSAYCNGPDLATWHATKQCTPTPIEAAAFVSKLARAVAYAHDQGVIHRDIKPSNILLASTLPEEQPQTATAVPTQHHPRPLSSYDPRLTDFGLAKLRGAPLNDTRSSLILGTPLYMAPEQLLPDLGPVTSKTDVYSLGALLAELLLGKPLQHGKTHIEILAFFQHDVVEHELLPKSQITGDLRTIICRCLCRVPENRFASAEALAQDLDAFVKGHPISARQLTLVNRAITWSRDIRRTREACVFSIAAMCYMTLWVLYSIGLIWGPTFQGGDVWQPTLQALAILSTINIPVMVLAYLGLRGRMWAMQSAALLLLFGCVLVPGLIIADVIGLLDPVYGPFPYFKKSFHSLVLFIGAAQVAYLAIGIYAHRWNTKRFTPPANCPL